MAEKPRFAARGSNGVSVMEFSSSVHDYSNFEKDNSLGCKVMEFSSDGRLLAWCNSERVTVFDFHSSKRIQTIPRFRANLLTFSSRNKYLITWENLVVTKENPREKENLEIWDIESGNCVTGFFNKKRDSSILFWLTPDDFIHLLGKPSHRNELLINMLKWTDDEKVCARCVTNEVHFFEDGNFETISNKLRLQGISCIEIAPGPPPYIIAAYVRGSKAAPSYVRLFQYPNFGMSSALANKSFFKAEKADIKWNKKGNAALIITSTEVDQSGGSYYGEQGLHFIATNAESNVVTLPKNGPIYALDWNPNSLQFCVVYGYMPAKATLFNLKCESVFDFGTGPRNNVYYNAHGNILCLAGFGNLRGQLEFWGLKQFKEINKIQASDSTLFEWCPDGQHFLTATTSPRLREGNGFKIWNWNNGECVYQKPINELWQVSWQPCPDGVFPETVVSAVVEAPKAKVQAYRPPQARGTQSTLKLAKKSDHKQIIDELCLDVLECNCEESGCKLAVAQRRRIQDDGLLNSNATTASATTTTSFTSHCSQSSNVQHDVELAQNQKSRELSGAALKNKKKRDSKARGKQDKETQNEAKGTEIATGSAPVLPSDKEKKLRNLKKKLRQIQELKEQKKAGKQLEKNQEEKLSSEDTLVEEIRNLELS